MARKIGGSETDQKVAREIYGKLITMNGQFLMFPAPIKSAVFSQPVDTPPSLVYESDYENIFIKVEPIYKHILDCVIDANKTYA